MTRILRTVARRRSGPAAATLAGTALALALTGCAVGPDFHRPEPPPIKDYLPESTDRQPGAGPAGAESDAQRFIEDMPVPARWWSLFESPALDALIRLSFDHSPTVQSAQAALREANENFLAARGALLPAAQAQYSFQRDRNAVGTLAPTLTSGESIFNLHTAQVSVSYVLDVFGGTRRQVESLRAAAQSQEYQLQATYLTLAANVASTAVQEASLRAQLAATEDIVRSEQEALDILRKQYDLGSIAFSDVMAQEAALANAQATVPVLRKQLEQTRHALAALAGRFPSETADEHFELSELRLPKDLPLTIPSRLVRQRPDVLAAEAQLHSASADVGVAVSNMLPQITLVGNAGGASTQFGQLLAAGNTFWSGGASLTQTLFQGGALLHKERAARAALDQAGAQYRSAVLTAVQNVADALTALQFDGDAVVASRRAEEAARESLATVRRNVELGSLGYLALLNAQQAYQQAVLNRAQAEGNRFSDTVALFQALGGGWQYPATSS